MAVCRSFQKKPAGRRLRASRPGSCGNALEHEIQTIVPKRKPRRLPPPKFGESSRLHRHPDHTPISDTRQAQSKNNSLIATRLFRARLSSSPQVGARREVLPRTARVSEETLLRAMLGSGQGRRSPLLFPDATEAKASLSLSLRKHNVPMANQ